MTILFYYLLIGWLMGSVIYWFGINKYLSAKSQTIFDGMDSFGMRIYIIPISSLFWPVLILAMLTGPREKK